jgi:hypothetical protein
MSPLLINSHLSAAHAEHSAIVPSCVSSLLHYQVPVNSHNLKSVAIVADRVSRGYACLF